MLTINVWDILSEILEFNCGLENTDLIQGPGQFKIWPDISCIEIWNHNKISLRIYYEGNNEISIIDYYNDYGSECVLRIENINLCDKNCIEKIKEFVSRT